MSILNILEKKSKLSSLYFFVLLFSHCSEIEINESELESCASLVHANGTTTLNDKIYTGSCIVYDGEGVMRTLLSYKKGIPHGVHRGYYLDGSIEYEGFRKNKEIHGKYIKYYPGGGVEMKGQFKRGIYDGKWIYYNIDGEISMEKTYIRGNVIDSIINQ